MQYYNISASEFAETLGIQRSSISHFLSGRNNPSLDVIKKILTAYPDISADWLILDEGEMFINSPKMPVIPQQPDLFAVKDEDRAPYYTKSELQAQAEKARLKDDYADKKEEEKVIANTDSLATEIDSNKEMSVERIVIFYKNGKFKEYLP